MDVKDVRLPYKWDEERLGNLARPLLSLQDRDNGGQVVSKVIRISSELAKCRSVGALAIFLNERGLLNPVDFHELSKDDGQPRNSLYTKLVEASGEKGRGEHIVESVYLSLLDLCLNECDPWCHYAAFKIVWENAVKVLEVHEHSLYREIAFSDVIAGVPEVELDSSTAWELRRQLNPSVPVCSEEITLLRDILREYYTRGKGSESKHLLYEVVKAMMLTPGVGRYVSKLLPFHRSYPMALLQFLRKLDKEWKKFARFIGFSDDEIRILSGVSTSHEWKNFSKVWRMPDLGYRTEAVLEETSVAANIVLGSSVGVSVPAQEQDCRPYTTINYNICYNMQPSSEANSPQPPTRSESQMSGHPSLGQVGRMHDSGSSDQDSEVPAYWTQHSSISDVDEAPTSGLPSMQPHHSRSDDPDSEPYSSTSYPGSADSRDSEIPVESSDHVHSSVPVKESTTKKKLSFSGPHQPRLTLNSPPIHKSLIHTSQRHSQSPIRSPIPANTQHTETQKHSITQLPHPTLHPQLKSNSVTEHSNTDRQKLRSPVKAHSVPHEFRNIQQPPVVFYSSPRESFNAAHHPTLYSPSKPRSLLQKSINSSPQTQRALHSAHKPQLGSGNPSTHHVSSPTMHPPQKSLSLPHGSTNSVMHTAQKSQSLPRGSTPQQFYPTAQSPLESHSQVYANSPQEPDPTVPKSLKPGLKRQSLITKPPLTNTSLSQSHTSQNTENEFEKTISIGNGPYGEVFEVHPKGDEKLLFAAKSYRNVSLEKLERIFTGSIHGLTHRNLVRYYGVCILPCDGSLALTIEALRMERAAYNLETFLSKTSDIRPQKKLSILHDVADGLAYLHARGIVHCDLTARNVLLTSDGTAKITDWVNSQVTFTGLMEHRLGIGEHFNDYLPLDATSAEEDDDPCSSGLDVFSFGHLSIYTVTQREPHPLLRPTYKDENLSLQARTEVERREEYINNMRDICDSQTMLRPLYDFVLKCLRDKAKDRPHIRDLSW